MKNKITCLVIDDEKEGREGLKYLIEQMDDLDLIGSCKNGIEAIDSIHEFKPDLIFLDIQMPHINGFEVLQHVKKKPAAIIFITAYDQFALKAFEVHAVDYLLKPFSNSRFYEAVDKAREKINFKKSEADISSLIADAEKFKHHADAVIYDNSKTHERLVVKADGKIHFVALGNLAYIEAYDYYMKLHIKDSYLLVRDTMKNMEKKLPKSQFVRIHKSYIVNLRQIKRIEADNVIIRNGEKLKISRTYKKGLTGMFQ